MNRKLLLPALAAATAALLAGCVTGYQYRQGAGDYYYGEPSVEYRDDGYYGGYGYGYPYGGYGDGWSGGLGFGFGYGYGGGYPYWGYGYPFGGYGYPYYNRHHGHHHHGGHDQPDPQDRPDPPPDPGTRFGATHPPQRPLVPRLTTRPPPLVRDPAIPLPPRMSTPMPQRQWLPTPPSSGRGMPPAIDRTPRMTAPARDEGSGSFRTPARMDGDRDDRRSSRH